MSYAFLASCWVMEEAPWLAVPAVVDVFPACPQNPQEVIARMLPEAGILLGDQRVDMAGEIMSSVT